MKIVNMPLADRETLFAQLAAMPEFLETTLGSLSDKEATAPGPDDSFAPVEQCWHLADLERDGYAVRIEKLLAESSPALADFDGARIAAEREYRKLSLPAGIAAFREARHANLKLLRALGPDQWRRGGTQEGVGAIALCDLAQMMAEHDAGHRQEIDAWLRARKGVI
jgi:hypothetical protein